MTKEQAFEKALELMNQGDHHALRVHLVQHPEIVAWRDASNSTLLLNLFELPDDIQNKAQLARVLLVAGSQVNARRNRQCPAPIFSAIRSEQLDVVQTLLEFGANLRIPAHPSTGTVLDYAIELCKEKGTDVVFSTRLRKLIYSYTGGKIS
ncbi:MAG: hypothetical protein F4X56_05530 [Gammaproteobacteria bacterium]|nr:hypothetical protein [Gammaproteobacteria bacterium]MYC25363.1 hypothetical protein [Gammaproteobacteria bacterium]